MQQAKGFTLIFVLGVLAMLALFAGTLVTISRIGMEASKNHSLRLRAGQVARSALLRTVAAAREDARKAPFTAMGPFQVRAGQIRASWLFRDDAGQQPGYGLPLLPGQRSHPSLRTEIDLGSRRVVCSGSFGATFAREGDIAFVKALDPHGQLNVNGEQRSLRAQLTVLGLAIQRQHGLSRNPIDFERAGKLLALRDRYAGRKFPTKSPLGTLFGEDYALVADYLAVHGWSSADTFVNVELRPTYPNVASLSPSRLYPVNLNTASRPVLTALLAGWCGDHQAKRFVANESPDLRGARRLSITRDPSLSADGGPGGQVSFELAWNLAGDILSRRRSEPFKGWADFRDWLGQVGTSGLGSAERRLLIVGLSPGYAAYDSHPDPPVEDVLDKAHLRYRLDLPGAGIIEQTGGTTEACFSTMGYLDVEVIAQLFGEKGLSWVEASEHRVIRYYEVYRHATQSAFERAARDDQAAPRFVFGDGLGGAVVDFTGRPSALRYAKTYPGPVLALGLEAAHPFGGYVLLGTDQEPTDAQFQTFAAQFETGLTADRSTAGQASPTKETRRNEVSPQSGGDLLPNGLVTTPLALPPPQLEYAGENVPVDQGAAAFWLKLHAPPDLGTNEVLLYVTHLVGTLDGNRQGVAWRLERFGTKLVSTRFHWGTPQPAVCGSPTYSWTEAVASLAGWRPGEWHHLAFTWENYIQPQQIFIDGAYVAQDSARVEARVDQGVSGRFYNNRNSSDLGTRQFNNTQFQLVSNAPLTRFQVGGYSFATTIDDHRALFERDPAGSDVIIPARTMIERYSNATLDNLRFFDRPAGRSVSPKRYPIPVAPTDLLASNGDYPEYRGEIALPEHSLVTGVSWQVDYPKGYNGLPLQKEDFCLDIQFRADRQREPAPFDSGNTNAGFTSLRAELGLGATSPWRGADTDPEFHQGYWSLADVAGNQRARRFIFSVKLFKKPNENVSPALRLLDLQVEGRTTLFVP